jgi:ABC-2 type transport system permease protein
MRTALTLAVKDLRLLARDRLALFWVLGFPLVMAFMFGAMFGGSGGKHDDDDGPGGIPVAVVDAERSAASAEFAKALGASGDVAVNAVPDAEAARRLVLSGDAAAYLVLESDFDGPGMLGGKPPRVSIGYAPSRRAEGAMLRGIVMQAAANRLRESLSSLGMGGGGAMEPVHVESAEVSARTEPDHRPRPATNWEITFPSSILWGLLGCAACFAVSLVTERQSGTYYRLKTAPVTRAHVLLGKGIACFLSCAFVLTLLLSIGILGLDVRVQNGPGLVLAAVCTALCFTGLMMFLATLGRTAQATSGMCWGIITLMSMLGGGMIPLFVMPQWMQTVSNVSPVKWGILALEGGIWRGFTLSQMARPCGVLLAVGAAGFVLGSAILARRDR